MVVWLWIIFYFLSIQKTMIMKEPDIQFRDNIFLNRASLTKHPRQSHRIIPQVKISRSTWTKKLRKYQEHEAKIGNENNSFENGFQDHSPLKNTRTHHYKFSKITTVVDTNREKNQPHPHQVTQIKEKSLKSFIPFHFAPNRNVYNQSLHEDLSTSGILIEKFENEHMLSLMPISKSKDSRKFLKSLKLKNSLNLFKGNFSKFTKKDIIHCIKTKRFNLTSDLQASC